MSLRRWVSLLAIFGVLLHAAAIVRHQGMMTMNSGTAVIAGLLDGSVICRSTPDDGSGKTTDENEKGKAACPICLGLVAAIAIEPPSQPELTSEFMGKLVEFSAFTDRDMRRSGLHPLGRGPPKA